MPALIQDTYAEAFRSLYVEFLVTARDRRWVEHAVQATVRNASSTIMCDCEAGVAQWIDAAEASAGATPDGRPGAVVQFHVPRFVKKYEDIASVIERTVERYAAEVRSRAFPEEAQTYQPK